MSSTALQTSLLKAQWLHMHTSVLWMTLIPASQEKWCVFLPKSITRTGGCVSDLRAPGCAISYDCYGAAGQDERVLPCSKRAYEQASKEGALNVLDPSYPRLRQFQLLDYDSARSRMNKLIQKPSDDPTRLPKVRLVTFPHVPRIY